MWSTTKALKWIWFPRDMLFDFRQEFEAWGGLLGQPGRKLETLSYSESLTKSNTKQNRRHICRISPQCNLSFSKTDFNSVNLKKYTPSYHWLAQLINWPSSQLASVLKVLLWYWMHFRNFTQHSYRHLKIMCQAFEGLFKHFLCLVFKDSTRDRWTSSRFFIVIFRFNNF